MASHSCQRVSDADLVLAHDQEQLGLRLLGLQLAQGVDGVGGARPPQLAVVDDGARHVGEGDAGHRQAVLGRAERLRLVPGLPGGKDAQLIELQLLDGGPRQRHMGDVGRIERAAEHAQARPGLHVVPAGAGAAPVKPSPSGPGTSCTARPRGEPGAVWRW